MRVPAAGAQAHEATTTALAASVLTGYVAAWICNNAEKCLLERFFDEGRGTAEGEARLTKKITQRAH